MYNEMLTDTILIIVGILGVLTIIVTMIQLSKAKKLSVVIEIYRDFHRLSSEVIKDEGVAKIARLGLNDLSSLSSIEGLRFALWAHNVLDCVEHMISIRRIGILSDENLRGIITNYSWLLVSPGLMKLASLRNGLQKKALEECFERYGIDIAASLKLPTEYFCETSRQSFSYLGPDNQSVTSDYPILEPGYRLVSKTVI